MFVTVKPSLIEIHKLLCGAKELSRLIENFAEGQDTVQRATDLYFYSKELMKNIKRVTKVDVKY